MVGRWPIKKKFIWSSNCRGGEWERERMTNKLLPAGLLLRWVAWFPRLLGSCISREGADRLALQATAVLAEPRCWLGKTPHSFLKLLYFKGSYRERQRERLVSIPTGQNEAASQEPGVHLGAGVQGRERRGLSETLKYNLGPRAHQYSRGSWENCSVTGRLTRLIPCPTNFWNRNWIPCKASDLMVCCLFINISSLT